MNVSGLDRGNMGCISFGGKEREELELMLMCGMGRRRLRWMQHMMKYVEKKLSICGPT